MLTFSIVAIPDSHNLQILNDLKLTFNKSGARGKVKDTVSDSHITLAQGTFSNKKEIDIIQHEIKNALQSFKPFDVSYLKVTKDKKGPNIKRNHEYYWIALTFKDENLDRLAKVVDQVLINLKLSQTRAYVDMVHEMDSASLNRSIVGDHMNICNYCLPEFVDDVYAKTVKEVPETFKISKVAFRYNSGEHAWEIFL